MEEIKLLNDIGRKRNETMKIVENEQNEKMLVKLGEPIKWVGYNSYDGFDQQLIYFPYCSRLIFTISFDSPFRNRY